MNASTPTTPAKNYFDKLSIKGRTATFNTGVGTSPTYTIFGTSVKGPQEMPSVNAGIVSPMNYVSTSPTNNPDSYDLWIDITYGGSGKNNRISNWSKDPQPF